MPNTKTDQATAFRQWDTVERTREVTRAAIVERRARADETVAADGSMDVINLLDRIGRPLQASDMQAKLAKINPNLRFEVAHKDPSKIGIYTLSHTRNGQGGFDRLFLCGMERHFMPEYSVIVPEEIEIPDPTDPVIRRHKQIDVEIRGWRTVLAKLLQARAITDADVVKHFPAPSGRSARWQKKIHPEIEVDSNGGNHSPNPEHQPVAGSVSTTGENDDRGIEEAGCGHAGETSRSESASRAAAE